MNNQDPEFYESRMEVLGLESADFVTDDLTFIRIQILPKGKVKLIPKKLVEDITDLIRKYNADNVKTT